MNRERRKFIIQARYNLEQAALFLNTAKEQEEESHDNLPESLAESDRAFTMEENIELLEDALNSIDEIMNTLEEIT